MDNRAGEMQVFLRVVEAGSFSSAARLMGMTPSTVSKLVARIETRIDIFYRGRLDEGEEIHALYPGTKRMPQRVRLFLDHVSPDNPAFVEDDRQALTTFLDEQQDVATPSVLQQYENALSKLKWDHRRR